MRRPGFWAGLAILATACAAPGADEAAPAYVIGPRDVVHVQAWWKITPTIKARLDVKEEVFVDGTVHLGQQGQVLLGGLTKEEAADAVRRQLAAVYHSAPASITAKVAMVIYGSQHLRVVTQLAGQDKCIHYVPFTGSEKVVDLVAAVEELPVLGSRCRMVVERPDIDGGGPPLVLPVDWRAITRDADQTTNYRLHADDRLCVRSDVASAASAPAANTPRKVEPVMVWKGLDSKETTPSFERCTTMAEWHTVWLKHCGANKERYDVICPEVDFDRFMVVALFGGESGQNSGIRYREVVEEIDCIHVRYEDPFGQWLILATADGVKIISDIGEIDLEKKQNNFLFVVLPKSKKSMLIEQDVRREIGKPAEWKTRAAFPEK